MNNRICILSYQTVHRKTIDVINRLKLLGYKDVCVYTKQFHFQKKYTPLVNHRPQYDENDSLSKADYKEIIINLGYEVCDIETYEQINEEDGMIFLVCGAGIIPNSFIEKYKVINSHPGYIPNVRGLDSLKWAIIEDQPIGVTLHYIGDYIDAGNLIERCKVQIYNNDTFHSVAYRQYELEIDLLCKAPELLDKKLLFTDGADYEVHKRMPNQLEESLYDEFEKYKKRHAVVK